MLKHLLTKHLGVVLVILIVVVLIAGIVSSSTKGTASDAGTAETLPAPTDLTLTITQ